MPLSEFFTQWYWKLNYHITCAILSNVWWQNSFLAMFVVLGYFLWLVFSLKTSQTECSGFGIYQYYLYTRKFALLIWLPRLLIFCPCCELLGRFTGLTLRGHSFTWIWILVLILVYWLSLILFFLSTFFIWLLALLTLYCWFYLSRAKM